MGNPFNAKRTRLSQYNKKAHAVSNLCRGVIPFSRFIEVNSSHFFPQQKITNLKKADYWIFLPPVRARAPAQLLTKKIIPGGPANKPRAPAVMFDRVLDVTRFAN